MNFRNFGGSHNVVSYHKSEKVIMSILKWLCDFLRVFMSHWCRNALLTTVRVGRTQSFGETRRNDRLRVRRPSHGNGMMNDRRY